jgi:hypothetical protein
MAIASDTASAAPPDWQSLRTRFKQLQVQTGGVHQDWQIRVHRSLSWLKRAEELIGIEDGGADLRFMLLWVSLSALYSRWDAVRNAPWPDADARGRFVERVCCWDRERVGRTLRTQRPLVKKLLENFYLSNTFWRDPTNPKAKGWAAADANYLDRNLRDGEYCKVLGQVTDRLYVLRGQLVHGAATGGGKLNRQTLKYCLALMRVLTPLLIDVTLEHGWGEDWPELCYPPVG